MRHYIALIHKDPQSDYGVSFPDFPGCVTAGADLDEARAMAVEALALHVEGMIEDGEAIPAPSTIEEVMAGAENRDGVVTLIVLQDQARRAVRANITFAEDVLNEIDAFAEAHGYTRSGFLAVAAKKVMKDEAA